jgi:hypothetical protein
MLHALPKSIDINGRYEPDMKPSRHSLLNTVTLLSLMVCTTAAGLWVLGRFRSDTVGWAGWKDESAGIWHGWGIQLRGGRFMVHSFIGKFKIDDPSAIDAAASDGMQPHFFHHGSSGRWPSSPSFRWTTIDPKWAIPLEIRLIAAPLWFLAALFAILPVWRGLLIVRCWRRRRVPGFCPVCAGFCSACGCPIAGATGGCRECGMAAKARLNSQPDGQIAYLPRTRLQ